MSDDHDKPGVWITYHYAPYEGCWQIVPHASAEAAANHLARNGSHNMTSVQFVPFGEELRP